MDKLTRESIITLAESVNHTIFEYVSPGIGLVTVSVQFRETRLMNMPRAFQSRYEVYTHIAGKEDAFELSEEYKVAKIVNEAVSRIEKLAENFQVVRRA